MLISEITTGKKCGSIFINLAFKRWLQWHLGEDIYQELDQTTEAAGQQDRGLQATKISSHDSEGEHMRELMKRFEVLKRQFKHDPDREPILLLLPAPFEDLDVDGKVWGGQVTIP